MSEPSTLGATFRWESRVDAKGQRRDVEYIEIKFPGDKSQVIDRPATEEDRRNYAREYQAWKRGESQLAASGTPLIALEGVTRSQAEELATLGIHTIEQLAQMPDAGGTWMGWCAMKQKAQKHVETAKAAAPIERALRAITDRDAEIQELRRELAALRGAKP